MQHHLHWKPLFVHHYENTLGEMPPNCGSVLLDRYVRQGIVDRFKKYIWNHHSSFNKKH